MKKNKILLLIAFLGLTIASCDYAFVVPEEVPDIPSTEDVSFATQVLPTFTAQCASCHKPGGKAPDLTAENAYQSINKAKYINQDSPESSLIYSYVAPDASTHSWKHLSAAQAQYLLVWIEQGAKNN